MASASLLEECKGLVTKAELLYAIGDNIPASISYTGLRGNIITARRADGELVEYVLSALSGTSVTRGAPISFVDDYGPREIVYIDPITLHYVLHLLGRRRCEELVSGYTKVYPIEYLEDQLLHYSSNYNKNPSRRTALLFLLSSLGMYEMLLARDIQPITPDPVQLFLSPQKYKHQDLEDAAVNVYKLAREYLTVVK